MTNTYLLIIRDSDGAILGSQRGVASFSGQVPDRIMGPFGDTPFATQTTLKPGYSSTLVEVTQPVTSTSGSIQPPNKQPRSPAMRWNGAYIAPSSESFRDTWLDAVDPQRVLDRLRSDTIADIRAHPTAPVSSEVLLRLIGETE